MKRYIPDDIWNYIKSFALYPDTVWYHIVRTRDIVYYHRLELGVRNFICRKQRKVRSIIEGSTLGTCINNFEFMLCLKK